MTSCEHRRTTAYSEDLRWRVVYQRHFLIKLSVQKIATNLNIDQLTVSRILPRFDETGDIQKATYPNLGQSHHLKKLTEIDEHLIIEVVVDRPGIYLHEIQQFLVRETGTIVSTSTICKFLHKQGFSRQKMVRVALQRSDLLQSNFRDNISIFTLDMFCLYRRNRFRSP